VIQVLLADDQELVRAGFAAIIDAQDDMRVVAEASDGATAVALTRELKPDVVLMDIRMPHMNGIDATRRLKAPGGPPIVVLTTFDDDEYVYEALKAGAAGFLLKDMPRRRLIDSIRQVAAGEAPMAPAVTRRLIEAYVQRAPATAADTPLAVLSAREREILALLARGLANDEIAQKLHLSGATVKSHLAHILVKLNLRDRIQAVILAYETGLVKPGE
jgi:DNA-binding NarL/FixJ family response regulator